MNEISTARPKGKLRITPGAGEPLEVDPEVVAGYHGHVNDVLSRIVAEHIRDPGLLAMLSDAGMVLEQYAEGPDGCEETPLSPTSDWDEIKQRLEQGDVEIGVARAHKGGRAGLAERSA